MRKQFFELYQTNQSHHSWQIATDQVMGGISQANMLSDEQGVHLHATVSFENSGGFAQLKWGFDRSILMSQFSGVWFEIQANQALEIDAVLKSSQLWMPWQSFRRSLSVDENVLRFEILFDEFEPYRTQTRLNINSITQFALLMKQEGAQSISVKKFGLFSL